MRPALLGLPLLLLACDPSEEHQDFTGGDFQFETYGVDDACFDGGFEVLFMPEGPEVVNAWGDPIYIPPLDELPASYSVTMPEPFSDMEVTVTGDEETREVAGADNEGVELDGDSYPGCLVDMSIDVSLVLDSATEVHGTAVLHTASFDEGTCPAVDSDPCDITLDLRGTLVD